jgi:hypothetical protein
MVKIRRRLNRKPPRDRIARGHHSQPMDTERANVTSTQLPRQFRERRRRATILRLSRQQPINLPSQYLKRIDAPEKTARSLMPTERQWIVGLNLASAL